MRDRTDSVVGIVGLQDGEGVNCFSCAVRGLSVGVLNSSLACATQVSA